MKNLLKNFWVTLTRFKMASALNIIGLAIAFAVFAIIMMQTNWELTYNHNFADHSNIFRVETSLINKASDPTPNIPRPIGDQIGKSSPAITDYTLYNSGQEMSFKILNSRGELINGIAQVSSVMPSFTSVFGLECLEGDFKDFERPDASIIDQQTAHRLFGDQSAIGMQLLGEDTTTIVAVFADLPHNCSFLKGVYRNIGNQNIDNTSNWNYHYYYKTTPGTAMAELKTGIEKILEDYGSQVTDDGKINIYLRLMPLDDIYFNSGQGNKALTSILIAIAFLIIGIAIINFINFFMAMVPIRIRSVNINKIFGTPTAALRANVIAETLGIVVISFLLSLLLIQAATRTQIADFVDCSLNISDNHVIISLVAIFAVATGVISGLYPAYYITKFSPMLVLQGSFGRSKTGQRMRMTLVTVQFVISIALIIAAIFVQLQTKFMRDHNMGFDRNRLLTVDVGEKIASQPQAFLDLLQQNPDIQDVAYSANDLVEVRMGWGRDFNGENIYLTSLPTSWNYPEFMDIKLIDGRYFIPDDATKTAGTMIVNETAAKRYRIKVGDFINGHSDQGAQVVGIAHDFNFRSMKYAIEPIVIYEFGSEGWYIPSQANIRISPTAHMRTTSDFIAKTIKQLDPKLTDEEIKIRPFDQAVENLYSKESKLGAIITFSSIVAIIIALVGIFGLVVFEVQYRRKEIALRKIHGATVASIPMMINRKFIYITALSAALAIPPSYYLVWIWVQEFAYRTPLHWWVAPVAVAIVLVISLSIVTIQTLKAATENPVKSLKSE